MVLKLSTKVHFLRFYADFSKKSKSVKAIYIYASKRSRYALSENGIVYYAMIYGITISEILDLKLKNFVKFLRVTIFFGILIANIS